MPVAPKQLDWTRATFAVLAVAVILIVLLGLAAPDQALAGHHWR